MAERFIPAHRRTQYKATGQFKQDELRRRREEQQVEIRKAKREENLAKRRGITARDGSQTSAPGASLGAAPDSDDDDGGAIESQVRLPTLIISTTTGRMISRPVLRTFLDIVLECLIDLTTIKFADMDRAAQCGTSSNGGRRILT